MTQSNRRGPQSPAQDVAFIVGGGPGISSSCARLFANSGMRVGIAARDPDKSVLLNLEETHGVRRYECDASEPAAVESLFQNVVRDLGAPTLVVHNIDGRVPGIFGKGIAEADPSMVLMTLRNSAFSAFLVGQRAARLMRENKLNANGTKGTIIFTNASAALKGFPSSGAFAMACHAKSGLAQSMARELMPQGIHIASVPIDAAIGWTQEDGTRAHRRAGTTATTIWPTRPASRRLICSCIASIDRPGRSKSCYDRGSRNGEPIARPAFDAGAVRQLLSDWSFPPVPIHVRPLAQQDETDFDLWTQSVAGTE
jgi:NAD(P)-dependent dehydrogenase (short-subunit alcohol dehydrogenase family)